MYNIFGSNGFIGTHLTKLLADKAYGVCKTCTSGNLDNDSIYLISTTDNYNVHTNVYKDISVNLIELMDRLKVHNRDRTFNFISSWFVYGNTQLPAGEHSNCHPKGFYSITKLCAEKLITSYCETFNINYRILRLANVYGPGDKPTAKKNAMQYLIEQMRLGKEIELYNNGIFMRNYIHVTDACKAIKLVCDKGPLNEIINIGGDNLMFRDIIELAAKQMKVTPKIKSVDTPEFHKVCQVKDFTMSTNKLRKLGFKRHIGIELGIRELVK